MAASGIMTLAELQELIAKSKGEGDHIEFPHQHGQIGVDARLILDQQGLAPWISRHLAAITQHRKQAIQ